jgi:uncharacterized protein YdeI (BOF family)
MPQQPMDDSVERHETERHETEAPSNPPNAVLRPAVRRTALWTYLGILVLFFLVVGGALVYFAGTGRGLSPDGDERTDPSAVGTSGDRMPREGTPGGFDPAPHPSGTESELRNRGAGEPTQGPMPGLRGLRDESPQAIEGRRIELENVIVERVDGDTFWIRDGDDRAAVITAGGMPTVRAGQRIDVSGTLERAGTDVRIRATRIDVR